MNGYQFISTLKQDSKSASLSKSIDIYQSSSSNCRLVPIGKWILDHQEIVTLMSRWREKSMRFFMAQFESSFESTLKYLTDYSISQQDRILFLVYVDDRPVGHIGLAEIKDGNAELDNMMRGESGGPIDLMLEAERTLINWAIECLALKSITLRIQSRNFLAMKNHFELGFVRSNRLPLMRVEKGNSFVLEPCEPEFATESFYMDVLTYSAIPKGS